MPHNLVVQRQPLEDRQCFRCLDEEKEVHADPTPLQPKVLVVEVPTRKFESVLKLWYRHYGLPYKISKKRKLAVILCEKAVILVAVTVPSSQRNVYCDGGCLDARGRRRGPRDSVTEQDGPF